MTSSIPISTIAAVVPRPTPGLAERVERAARTTPGRYRIWSVVGVVVLVLAIVATVASATGMRASTRRAETNSGPVLVATEQVVSSLAEADAAATAAFLSGVNEDPEQRRLYEQALARINQQVDDIASLAGQDRTVKAVVERISVQVTQFGGLVEAARASNRASSPDAGGYLVSAIQTADQLVTGDVKILAGDAQAALLRDEAHRTHGLALAWLVVLTLTALLIVAQLTMYRRFRRLLNLPLVAATVLALVAMVWLARASQTSGQALAGARQHGYDSIELTAQLSNAGFGAKTAETLAVITGDTAQRAAADTDARLVAAGPITAEIVSSIRQGNASSVPGGLFARATAAADTPREWAAVAEAAQRWQRYQDTVASLRTTANPAAAKAIAESAANSDFNGFNFSVEAILGQNRDQFLSGLASAANGTSRVPTGVPVLLLAALATMVLGFQLRIDEYR